MMETVKKPSYKQDWPAYTKAQVNEKTKFLELLYALCGLIEDPPHHMGRLRVPLADRIFAGVFKVYSTVSGRRFDSDLRKALQRGYLYKAPTYGAIYRYFESEELTPVLKQLIIESSLPLKAVELDFAVDSSGFSTGVYKKWVDAKWGVLDFHGKKQRVKLQDWVKAHLMCGVKTNIVTAVKITHARSGDSPQFEPLVEATSQNFQLREVSADKAYSSAKNLFLVESKGGEPYIPFRKSTTVDSYWVKNRQPAIWKRMYHQYMANQGEFMRHYHKRSNVETTFSMIKRKFGDRLRSRTPTAQANEVLCKILAHNLCVLVQSMYELGIEVTFSSNGAVDEKVKHVSD